MTVSQPQTTQTGAVPRRRPRGPRFTPLQLLALGLFAVYSLLPLWWVIVTVFKDNGQLFSSFGLWFAPGPSHLAENLSTLLTRQDGIFTRWLLNSVLYAGATALGSVGVSAMAGYAFSMYGFRGKDALFSVILATIMVPATALVLPIFLMLQQLGLLNTYWAVILPGLVNPFGLYLMRLFWDAGFPKELMEAARIDGAGEWTIFRDLGLPLVRGGLVTVGLFAFVGAWNNFFLPLVAVSRDDLFPLTLGLSVWNQTSSSSGQEPIYTVIVLGALISVLPLILAFLTLGRYWQGGLASGAVKG